MVQNFSIFLLCISMHTQTWPTDCTRRGSGHGFALLEPGLCCSMVTLHYKVRCASFSLSVLCCSRCNRVSSDTICSIFAQENQYKVLKSHHIHKEQMHNYCTRYAFGEDVLELCASVDFPPCMMMRRMLELLLNLGKQVCGKLQG
eukprot:GHRR01034419.1.p2 GENE.GHRR01034419.1~~GHRR01034419.1.p2  ORF type:complete len:145 (+),score=17.46 GHRR01034419.1:766-1200(+)